MSGAWGSVAHRGDGVAGGCADAAQPLANNWAAFSQRFALDQRGSDQTEQEALAFEIRAQGMTLGGYYYE